LCGLTLISGLGKLFRRGRVLGRWTKSGEMETGSGYGSSWVRENITLFQLVHATCYKSEILYSAAVGKCKV